MGLGLEGLAGSLGPWWVVRSSGEGPAGLSESSLCTRASSPAAPQQILMSSSKLLVTKVTECIVQRRPLWLTLSFYR